MAKLQSVQSLQLEIMCLKSEMMHLAEKIGDFRQKEKDYEITVKNLRKKLGVLHAQ